MKKISIPQAIVIPANPYGLLRAAPMCLLCGVPLSRRSRTGAKENWLGLGAWSDSHYLQSHSASPRNTGIPGYCQPNDHRVGNSICLHSEIGLTVIWFVLDIRIRYNGILDHL